MISLDPAAPLIAQLRPHRLDAHCPLGVELLYRFYGVDDLLYIGITVNPPIRWQSHRTRADWWQMVCGVSIEEHKQGLACYAEVRAIKAERPRFNLRSAVSSPVVAPVVAPVATTGPIPVGKRKGREGIGNGDLGYPSIDLTVGAETATSGDVAIDLTPTMDDF